MDMNREKLLRNLMAADFTVIDLNLYLNTHPYDQNAICIYNQSVQRAKILRENYERIYGPLTPAFISSCPYQWVEGPWPWEKGRFSNVDL